jgi:hypothetical protein
MTLRNHRLLPAGLSACVLGLVLCPAPYIVIATRAELRPDVGPWLRVASYLVAAVILLIRYLHAPSLRPASNARAWAIEVPCWIVVGVFLDSVSRIHLMTGLQRWGAASMLFLAASLLALPVVWLHRTSLEQRLAVWPRVSTILALAALIVLAALAMSYYLATPAQFI